MSPRLGSREDIALLPEVEATMKLNSRDLKSIAVLTLQHYNEHAEDFLRGTRDHDVSQNIAALLQYIDCKRPSTILDFGCGPGRDLKAFGELGHIAVGLEGSTRLAAMARATSGFEVWEQDFLTLDLPNNRFDGVFANAALFHVAKSCRGCWNSMQHGNRAVCYSARTRTAITRKAEAASATARITISRLGAASCRPQDFLSCLTITALPVCRANSNRGSQACGASSQPLQDCCALASMTRGLATFGCSGDHGFCMTASRKLDAG
jgi:SAM-dependent methyltransferase